MLTRVVATVLGLAVMITLIVGLDLTVLRNLTWARLVTNIAIVAVFAAAWLRFARRV